MPVARIRRRAAVVALAGGLVLGACASDPAEVSAANDRVIEKLDVSVPLSLAGLEVVEEDIAETLEKGRRPYLDAATLYSFREEDLLQATLQIGRFADDVDPDDEDFRNIIITNIGPGAREVRMGTTELYVTGADRQTLSIWFADDHLYILSTRDGFAGGRSLLREALEIRA